MAKITDIKKQKTKYMVIFDDQVVNVEPVIYIKYHLKLQQVLEPKTYKKLIDENHYEIYKRIGLNKLKRVQTKKELFDFLIKKEAPIGIAKQLVKEFEDKKYLDDYQYTKTYVQLNQNLKGPEYIENQLVKKGVNISLVKSFTEKINEQPVVDHLIEKKLKLLVGRKTKKQIQQKLKTDLMRLGFHMPAIENGIFKYSKSIPNVNQDVLVKAYSQIRRKIKSEHLTYEDKQKIIQKLYQKGFQIDMIIKMIECES